MNPLSGKNTPKSKNPKLHILDSPQVPPRPIRTQTWYVLRRLCSTHQLGDSCEKWWRARRTERVDYDEKTWLALRGREEPLFWRILASQRLAHIPLDLPPRAHAREIPLPPWKPQVYSDERERVWYFLKINLKKIYIEKKRKKKKVFDLIWEWKLK